MSRGCTRSRPGLKQPVTSDGSPIPIPTRQRRRRLRRRPVWADIFIYYLYINFDSVLWLNATSKGNQNNVFFRTQTNQRHDFINGPIMDTLWTHYELIMEPLWTHSYTCIHKWTHYGPIMNPLWTHYGPIHIGVFIYGPIMDPFIYV